MIQGAVSYLIFHLVFIIDSQCQKQLRSHQSKASFWSSLCLLRLNSRGLGHNSHVQLITFWHLMGQAYECKPWALQGGSWLTIGHSTSQSASPDDTNLEGPLWELMKWLHHKDNISGSKTNRKEEPPYVAWLDERDLTPHTRGKNT